MDELLTARQAARRFRMSAKAVSMWHSTGWQDEDGQARSLTIRGYDESGARQYSWLELLEAERTTRRKPRYSHRRTLCPTS